MNRRELLDNRRCRACDVLLPGAGRRSAPGAPRTRAWPLSAGAKPVELQSIWLETLQRGATKINRALPERLEWRSRFTATSSTSGTAVRPAVTNDIQAKGSYGQYRLSDFRRMSPKRCAAAPASPMRKYRRVRYEPDEQGPQNWAWVQAIIRAIDRNAGGVSQSAIERSCATSTFIQRAPAFGRDRPIVGPALNETPCVVIGHSLGLGGGVQRAAHRPPRAEGAGLRNGWVSPGDQGGPRPVRPIGFPAPGQGLVQRLRSQGCSRALSARCREFSGHPAVENYGRVRNATDNRHGIIGYLDDPDVARHVLDALGT